jgi:hypothetical protein
MAPPNTKNLRLDYHNEWPATFHFPIELKFLGRLGRMNIAQPLRLVPLVQSSHAEFHMMLSSLLDALDMLPLRPDRAFESIWTALDAEMFSLVARQTVTGSPSRFQVFMDHLENFFPGQACFAAMLSFMDHVPLQSCEYAATRILEAMNAPGKHSDYFLKKIKPAVGQPLLDEFNQKYGPSWLGVSNTARGLVQRKAGLLLKKLLTGEPINIGGLTNHTLAPKERIRLFVCALLPNVRNERFHGINFSSYRSSAVELKTYAAGYFILMLAYFLLLHVFIYRGFNVVTLLDVERAIVDNTLLYEKVFGQYNGD